MCLEVYLKKVQLLNPEVLLQLRNIGIEEAKAWFISSPKGTAALCRRQQEEGTSTVKGPGVTRGGLRAAAKRGRGPCPACPAKCQQASGAMGCLMDQHPLPLMPAA